jgi:anaerobic glycerol-3-phosphate dehydrogenase
MTVADSIDLDVLVLGGGAQGLLCLRAVLERGYHAALLTDRLSSSAVQTRGAVVAMRRVCSGLGRVAPANESRCYSRKACVQV